jgi:hypothetical protein
VVNISPFSARGLLPTRDKHQSKGLTQGLWDYVFYASNIVVAQFKAQPETFFVLQFAVFDS